MTTQSPAQDFQDTHSQDAKVDLDITRLTCPMTFVRVRLLLDRLSPGTEATVLLRGEEPRANIPRQLVRLGHAVLALDPVGPQSPAGAWRLTLRKAG